MRARQTWTTSPPCCTSKACKLSTSHHASALLQARPRDPNTQFTCFTGTKVQILTDKALAGGPERPGQLPLRRPRQQGTSKTSKLSCLYVGTSEKKKLKTESSCATRSTLRTSVLCRRRRRSRGVRCSVYLLY